MKNWYLIPLAALVGFSAGTWGSRSDVKAARAEVEAAKAAAQPNASSGFDAFARMANIPDRARRRHRHAEADESEPAAPSEPRSEPAETNETAAVEPPRRHGPDFRAPEDLAARIDEAADLWRTRVEIAKTQWKTKLGVSEEDDERFEEEIDAMNESLRETMSALAQAIAEKGRMTPELGLRMVGDASGIMAEAYENLASVVPDENLDLVSELPVFEFIDPSVAEPLIEVQELMR